MEKQYRVSICDTQYPIANEGVGKLYGFVENVGLKKCLNCYTIVAIVARIEMDNIMIIANKLKKEAHIRVIAPSRSLKIISDECRKIAKNRLAEMGIRVSYSKNADEMDEFVSSSVESRLEDLHEAFADNSVDAILTAIGGYNSNEILSGIDYDLIRANPKIICGFSDITALCNAIYAKTGLVTYSGPHFSTFGMLKGLEYTLEYFRKCFFQDQSFEIEASHEWADDAWFLDQENRNFIKNEGHWLINKGRANGVIVGGNLGLLDELKGTPYFPDIKGSILFLEHCAEHDLWVFSRNLQALVQHPDFKDVKGVVFGRFQPQNNMARAMLEKIIFSKEELKNLPIVANVNFGHTTPIITFPIGGECCIDNGAIRIEKF